MNDLSLALIRKGKGTGVVAGTTSHDLELALAEKYGSGDEPAPTLTAYLTFESASLFTLTSRAGITGKTWDGTLAYSRDCVKWFIWDGTKPLKSKQGPGNRHYLYLGGYGNTKITGNDTNVSFKLDGNAVESKGDIRALLDYEKAAADEDPVMADYCFSYLFADNENYTGGLTSLPSKTLADSCYAYMFSRCTAMRAAPELPATTLAALCYLGMFYSSGIMSAPELPATTLARGCYSSMFQDCSYLYDPPELPATTLVQSCYSQMFAYSGIRTAPELPATTLKYMCYADMFAGCGGLTSAPELPATTLAQGCYSSMFQSCTSLTAAPAFPAAIVQQTYGGSIFERMFLNCTSLIAIPEIPINVFEIRDFLLMFAGCTSIGFSETQTPEYGNEFRIPSSGTGTDYSSGTATDRMFQDTSGTFVGSPAINTTYYTDATIMPAA